MIGVSRPTESAIAPLYARFVTSILSSRRALRAARPQRAAQLSGKGSMARVDAIVLGAGIVGTSIALHLAKRGLAVALLDRRAPGQETSYGNAGVIEGNTLFSHPFPSDPITLLRIALKRAPEANYHLTFLPQVAPWLLQFRAASRPERLVETARLMRP